jgi:hypothetical protein
MLLEIEVRHYPVNVCDRELKVSGRLVRIARLDGEKFRFVDDPKPILERLAESRARVDIFTFIQRLTDTKPRFTYLMEWDNLAAIPVSTFENWWAKQIGFKARNKAKQAEKKGVVIREVLFSEVLVRGIWKIYNECPIRQGRRFPHYGKDFEKVYRETATYLDSSIFIGAFIGDQLIGFIKLLIDENAVQAGLLNIVSLISERDKAPTNALVAAAVKACASRNISFLTYSNFSYGSKLSDTLSDFKERNAFQRIEVPRYYVPLTALGHAALRLGLHHRLSEKIPESFAARLREIREGWYKRRFSNFSESA